MTPASGIVARLMSERRTADEIRDAVYLSRGDVAAKQTRFWLLLVLSATIATAGIIDDSTATVIGAMIIAPLATPIQGIAAAIAYGEVQPLARSVLILLTAVAVVVGLAAGLAHVLPQLEDIADNTQIAARVSPTVIDLVAAATTGLAGAFAIARRDVGDILPGVAIAISLVPPLAVVGVTAEAGDWGGALGALLLFVTNVLAIIVVGIALFGLTRVQRTPSTDGQGLRTRPVVAVVVVGATVVVAALAVTTARTVQLSDRLDAVATVASRWASDNDERFINARFSGSDLVIVVEGMSNGSRDAALPRLLAGSVPDGTDVVVNRVAGSRRTVGAVQ